MIIRSIISFVCTGAIAISICLSASCTRDVRNEERAEAEKPSGLIRYAKGFRLDDRGDYHLLRIFSPFQPGDTMQYILLKKTAPAPDGFNPEQIIRTPINSIAVTSSLHVGAVDQLEAWNNLAAVGDGSQVYSARIRDRIAAGSIREIQKGGQINQESVIDLHPDVLMVTGSPDAGHDAYAGIQASGIPVIVNSEWMETSPLGRAEWIKLMAVLFDKLNFAQHQFALVASNYERLAEKVKSASGSRPKVLLGNEFQGTWHMPGGKSFMAALLKDAGADYPWKDNDQTGGIPLAFESVYPVALEADAWLNIFLPATGMGKAALLSADPRYQAFKPVQNNRLYSFNGRLAENGANDYWESSAYRPDLLLADYVHILHPDVLSPHALYYCNELKP